MAGAISLPMQWVLQQCCTFLVVSSAFSAGVDAALLRGAGVLAGGFIQFLLIKALWGFFTPAETAVPDPINHPPGWRLAALRENFTIDSPVLRFALRLSFIAVVSVAVYRSLDFKNAYWIPMTALLVPKPDKFATLQRDVARVLGTIAGAGFATLLAVAVHPQLWMLVVLVGVFMWAAYAFQNVNYAAFVVMLTGYIAFLLAIGRQPETLTVWHRIIATIIGGLVAMMAYFIYRNVLLIWRESRRMTDKRL
jgi:uncharacterized membrane protein YccC